MQRISEVIQCCELVLLCVCVAFMVKKATTAVHVNPCTQHKLMGDLDRRLPNVTSPVEYNLCDDWINTG